MDSGGERVHVYRVSVKHWMFSKSLRLWVSERRVWVRDLYWDQTDIPSLAGEFLYTSAEDHVMHCTQWFVGLNIATNAVGEQHVVVCVTASLTWFQLGVFSHHYSLFVFICHQRLCSLALLFETSFLYRPTIGLVRKLYLCLKISVYTVFFHLILFLSCSLKINLFL